MAVSYYNDLVKKAKTGGSTVLSNATVPKVATTTPKTTTKTTPTLGSFLSGVGNSIMNSLNPTQSATPTVTPTVAPVVDNTKYINDLAEVQKQKQMADLKGVYDKNMATYATQKAEVQPLYYDKRSQESTASQLGAKNFAEYLANRGQTNAGIAGQAELNRNMTLQNNIGALNRDENKAYTDISSDVAQAKNDYNNGIMSANADVEAQKLQNFITQGNADRTFNYTAGRDNKQDAVTAEQTTYNRSQDTLDRTDKINEAMGYINPTANISVSQADKQALQPYMNDLDAFIQANPNNPLANSAKALRNEKIFSSPELLKQYGEDFRTTDSKLQELQTQSANLEIQGAQIDLEQKRLASLPDSPENQVKLLQVDVAKAQLIEQQKAIEKAEVDLKYADQLQQLEIKKAQAQINATNADTANTYSAISNRNVSGSSGSSEAETKSGVYAQAFQKLKSLSVPKALASLQDPNVQASLKAQDIDIKALWNDVTKDAIRLNTPGVFDYDSYYKLTN